MITLIICFADSFIRMFTGNGFIVSFDYAFCAGMFELIITIGLAGIYQFYKGELS